MVQVHGRWMTGWTDIMGADMASYTATSDDAATTCEATATYTDGYNVTGWPRNSARWTMTANRRDQQLHGPEPGTVTLSNP